MTDSPRGLIYSSQEIANRIAHARRHSWVSLDLSNLSVQDNDLVNLLSEDGVEDLQELDLSGSQLWKVPKQIDRLVKLRKLGLAANHLQDLPYSIGALQNLTELRLGRQSLGLTRSIRYLGGALNRFQSLPESLCHLTSLELLDLELNGLSELPPEIEQLTALATLDISRNELSELPPEIASLVNLKTLDVSKNNLAHLPPEVGNLTGLHVLDLSRNRLSTLPREMGQLASLQELYLSGNHLTTLPDTITLLSELRVLGLAANSLSRLPNTMGHLSKLKELYLGSNSPDAKSINIIWNGRGNYLKSLPKSFGQLTNLQVLDLRNNELETLPETVKDLTSLKALALHGNDELGLPPEILGANPNALSHATTTVSPSAVLEYYFHTRIERTLPLNEAKLVLIGDGEVGKTALVNLLVNNTTCTGNERQTQRIEIVPWKVERHKGVDIRLNVWDFGGQEIMHATHQFFLTERTLYLVVIDARRGQSESRLEYWIKTVQSRAKNSPVIVVINKIDEYPLKLDEQLLRSKYGNNIRDFAYVSCQTGERADELRRKIRHHVLGLEHIDTRVPAAWIAVKERLESTRRPWVTYAQYQKICNNQKVSDIGHQQQLIRFLHDLGIMLSFFHENLEETRVLAPEWVTRGVYAIITSKRLATSNGLLYRSDLNEILPPKQYPAPQRQFIVDMMREFELCFRMEASDGKDDVWLIPGLLAEMRPPTAELPLGALRFQYKYRVLPPSVISRFIVRTFHHLDSSSSIYWRNGIVLEVDSARVRVIADPEERIIDIAVTGDGTVCRRAALTFVREHFKVIHGALRGMEPIERVPLPDQPEIAVPYKMLLELEVTPDVPKPYRWWHDDGFTELDVEALLNGVEAHETRRSNEAITEPEPHAEVFLSYAHKDTKWRNELLTMLAPVLRGKYLDVWHDAKLKPSHDWRDEIQAALRRARVGVLLISKNFLASDFINTEELPFLLSEASKANVKLSWILLGDCMFDNEEFAKLQALHNIARPLSSFRGNTRDKILKEIAHSIVDLTK